MTATPIPLASSGAGSAGDATAAAPRDIVVGRQYLVSRAWDVRPAVVLNSRVGRLGAREVYVSFVGEDKRLDCWVGVEAVGGEVVDAGPSGSPPSESHPSAQAQAPAPATLAPPAPPAPASSSRSTPEREHELVTRVRNFEDVRCGEYLIKTWYYSPYPMADGASFAGASAGPVAMGGKPDLGATGARRGRKRKDPPDAATPAGASVMTAARHHVLSHGVGQGGEGARGRLWVCDLCFKYMHTRAGWERHTGGCTQMQPPGRKVYQRDNYTIWEVDGAAATLYCQNLSLFGKLFIDHKSVFFHVENFLFYVLCDAVTSRRDQVMAFFSKEKTSYDDYNLACIVTFPPFQNRGFGKLLIEFSYYLTRSAASPGTPERPLSDLGLKGYLAFWAAAVLRACRALLADGEAPSPAGGVKAKPTSAAPEGRSLRTRRLDAADEVVVLNGTSMTKRPTTRGNYTVTTTLADLARACNLRTDDVVLTLTELGLLRARRPVASAVPSLATTSAPDADELGEWAGIEVVIARDAVDAAWDAWRVREQPVLDERFCL